MDAAERSRAWERYRIMRDFVESSRCRHRQICVHFGEAPKWEKCDACDVCGSTAEWMAKSPATASFSKSGGKKRLPLEPVAARAERAEGEDEETDDLREYLREWRRTMAKEKSVPAYIVLHDSSLEEICRLRPKFFAELLQIPGIGERKAELYGQPILDALGKFGQGERASGAERKIKPADETLRLLGEGKTLEEIAQIRGRQLSTIVNGAATLLELGQVEFQEGWVTPEKQSVIRAACSRVGFERLKPVKDILPPEVTYDEIRLVVAKLRREQSLNKAEGPA
jgi:ATP-dependent DNA helicase RecQ